MKKCNGKTEVYSRVCGFFRPVQQWNKGKKEEFKERVEFTVDVSALETPLEKTDVQHENRDEKKPENEKGNTLSSLTVIESLPRCGCSIGMQATQNRNLESKARKHSKEDAMVKKVRPKSVPGETVQMNSPCGKIFVTLNSDPETGRLIEVFVRFGKSGTCASLVANALTMVTSYGLRSGMDVSDAIKGLTGHGCHKTPVIDGDEKIMSCVDAIGKAIRLHTDIQEDSGEQ